VTIWSRFRSWLRAALQRSRMESEMDAELRFHMEAYAADLVRSGVPRNEASRLSRIEFGGIEQTKEECRDMRKVNWIEDLVQDVQYAVRMLAKNPGFTVVAMLTLALGIGANTALFSVVNAVLLKPLPFRNPGKIVALWETETAPGSFPLTGEDYLDWRAQNSTFEDMSLYSWPNSYNVSGKDGAEGASVVRTQANFFSLLGVPAQIGRTFATGEDQNGGSRVAVVGDGFWKKHFGGQGDIVGRPLELNGESFTVIGVMPMWYRLPGQADIWVPLDMSKDKLGKRGSHSWKAIGRVKDDVPISQALADLRTIAKRLEKQFPDNNKNVDAIVTPMKEDLVGDLSSQLWIMFGAVGLVLLIACANVANLLLARAASRRQEMAVRGALGAGRGRLGRQLLTESVLLSLVSGSLGVVIAYGGVDALKASLPATVPQPNPVEMGLVPLAFAFLTCLAVGILFGLAPALQSSGIDAGETLKSKGAPGASTTKRGHWLRNTLVAGEIALSLALLIGAALLLRTFARLRATDVGVQPANVLTATVLLPESKYKAFDQRREFFDQLLQKLQTSPGVKAAAITDKLPLLGGRNGYIKIPGQQTDSMSGPLVESTSMGGNYFGALGIPLLAGREFERADYELTAKFMREVIPAKSEEETRAVAKKYTLPAIINQTMARTFWPKQDAVGKIFEHFVTLRVVGVVGDVRQGSLHTPAMPEAYYPLDWNLDTPSLSIVVKGDGRTAGLTGTVRGAVQSQDANLALMQVRPMVQIITESMTDTAYETVLLGGIAVLALILASVGIYGVMSYVVGQRTNEIGIRMALGAEHVQIVGMVLRQGAAIIGIGILAGLGGAVASAKFMEGLLVGVKPIDPATYAGVAGMLAAVALLACYLPARRAMRVDPMVALRYE
jgi:putative ABC transport system permease protein